MGKIFHVGQGDENSWSEPMPRVWRPTYGTVENIDLAAQLKKENEVWFLLYSHYSLSNIAFQVNQGPVYEMAPENSKFEDDEVADAVKI